MKGQQHHASYIEQTQATQASLDLSGAIQKQNNTEMQNQFLPMQHQYQQNNQEQIVQHQYQPTKQSPIYEPQPINGNKREFESLLKKRSE